MTISPQVRRVVLKRAQDCCEDCGEKTRLELHHLRYSPEATFLNPFRTAHPYWETPDDLDALCRDCHHNRHIDLNGEFWRDPEELEDHWFGYYWAMDKDD